MKTTPFPNCRSVFSRRSAAFLAAALLGAGGVPTSRAVDWKGADGLGGDGAWSAANFSSGTTPTSSTDVVFDLNSTYTNPTALVSITSGTARARGITVQNGKDVTLSLSNSTALTLNDRVISVGGTAATAPNPSSSSLTIAGPATGSATLTATRLYLEGNTANLNTSHRNSLVLTGNLVVNLTGSFNVAGVRSSIEIVDGAQVTTNPGAVTPTASNGAFYARGGKTGELYNNFVSIRNASLHGGNVFVYGLFQLGAGGVLGVSPNVTSGAPRILVTRGSGETFSGRFEVEGSGLAANLSTRIDTDAMLAVGLSNPLTGERSGAATFTLNSRVDFAEGSLLELGIFSDTEADKIVVGETGSIYNYSSIGSSILGTGAKLVLNLNGGFTPTEGAVYTLFEADPLNTGAFSGTFDLSLIDTALWDLSRFNSEGGWQVVAVPEPGTVSLLGLSGLVLASGALRRLRNGGIKR